MSVGLLRRPADQPHLQMSARTLLESVGNPDFDDGRTRDAETPCLAVGEVDHPDSARRAGADLLLYRPSEHVAKHPPASAGASQPGFTDSRAAAPPLSSR